MKESRWKTGDRLTHRHNPDLGPGLVKSVDVRRVTVRFPETDTVLTLATDSDALRPLNFRPGSRATLLATGEDVIISSDEEAGVVQLSDGREVDASTLWPLNVEESLVDRLASGEIDTLGAFALRLEALYLAAIREADGLGSFLGGRIRLLPHQIYAAEQATASMPTRWLLADEVGLGKTVEACLVLNHLLLTGRANRTLVIAPETLTIQWLGELWRKYHQVFVLLDEKRLTDVGREYGPGFNPFEAYPRTVVGLDFLCAHPQLTKQAAEAGIDLLIVDEAHHLRRALGHPGNPAYRAIAPIAALGRNLLLLSGTPLDEDPIGFFRLVELARPDAFTEQTIEDRLHRSHPLPPCTSAARRQDIPGLPPRLPSPVDLSADKNWTPHLQLEGALQRTPAANPVTRRNKLRKLRRVMASGSAVHGLLDGDDDLRQLALHADRHDPRLTWLGRMGKRWKQAREKTLVFVANRETLELFKSAMSRLSQLRVGVFHEDLPPKQRDIEVAQFRLPNGPSLLVSTECGGEGRNFEFCTRLVLFDLPWDPSTVEQRIGRLDRIERRIPVEIVYFRPASTIGAAIVDTYESLGLFRESWGGLDRELADVRETIERLVLGETPLDDAASNPAVHKARRAHERMRTAALHALHRDPYQRGMAEHILARIPPDLEKLTKTVTLAAAEQLDLQIDEHHDGQRYSIELGTRTRVETLPGVPAGSSFLGTFDREEAVLDESIDFFGSGHPLVEGLLTHLNETTRGRVALLHINGAPEGFGVLGLYKDGPTFSAIAIDRDGQERPEWTTLLTRRPLRSRRVTPENWTRQPGWTTLIQRLGQPLEERGRPVAIAAFRVSSSER
jgi:ATP-dependent helicase HepA